MRRYSLSALRTHLSAPAPVVRRERTEVPIGQTRPSDSFNEYFTEADILSWLGFEPSHTDNQGEHWVRPEKSARDGSSATIYDDGEETHVTIWSDTVLGWYPHLETRRPYDAYGLYVCTFHDGDFAAAARGLIDEGFGDPFQPEDDQFLNNLKAALDVEESQSGPRSRTSWWPLTGAELMQGSSEPPPDLFERDGGVFLLYRGRINVFQGEPESAKSWGAQAALVECIERGGRGAMIDFENSSSSVRDRMLALGLDPDLLATRFQYIRPDEGMTEGSASHEDLVEVLATGFDMIVVDGVTDGMALMGLNPQDLQDAGTFDRRLLRLLSDSGAAVIVIDHVVKSAEGRGRWAIGSQHKRAAITGAQYIFEKVHEFGRGMNGMSRLVVGKDKGGFVRQQARGDTIAEFWLDGTTEGMAVFSLKEPSDQSQTHQAYPSIMETLSNYIGVNAGERKATILTSCGSTAESRYLDAAFDKLQSGGYIANDMGDRNRWRLVRPYEIGAGGPVVPKKVIDDVVEEERMNNLRSSPAARLIEDLNRDENAPVPPKFVESTQDDWAML